jgi:hypothetical protein
MGYFIESFTELQAADGAWMDMGMYIGAGSSMPGWYTVIASVMLVAILVKGNNDEQDHYK